MTVMKMFSSPSAAHQVINRQQLGRSLDLMAHHSQLGGDSSPGYYAASSHALEAMEPAYQHEMQHRHRERNPYGIEAVAPREYSEDPDTKTLMGQHQTRHGDYTLTTLPYAAYGRAHLVMAQHPSSPDPVGEVKWNPHGGEIEWAHTTEKHRRQGLSSALVSHGREAGSMTPGMTSPLPSPELSSHGLGLSRGILSKEQWG